MNEPAAHPDPEAEDRLELLKQLSTDFSSTSLMDYHLNPSARFGYLYLENPKVASTTILENLLGQEFKAAGEKRNLVNPHERGKSPLPRLEALPLPEARKFLFGKDIFRFSFVRNPYARLLSGYLSKIDRNLEPKRRILSILQGVDTTDVHSLDTEVSFHEFVDVVCSQATVDMDPHWKPQHAQILHDRLELDFIGRLESFNADFGKIYRRLFDGDSSRLSVSKNQTNSAGKLSTYYDTESITRVVRRFGPDFEIFNYSTALPE